MAWGCVMLHVNVRVFWSSDVVVETSVPLPMTSQSAGTVVVVSVVAKSFG